MGKPGRSVVQAARVELPDDSVMPWMQMKKAWEYSINHSELSGDQKEKFVEAMEEIELEIKAVLQFTP